MAAEAGKRPSSPTAIELAIQERRAHLAATVDELTARTRPAEIARRTAAGGVRKARTLTHAPDGKLRTERLAAVGAAVVVVVGVFLVLRRRRR